LLESHWKYLVFNGGENSWSLSGMKWEGKPRWNGGSEDPRFPGIGNPQSRGVPTWFILPDEVGQAVLSMLELSK
jgi:hypothetical protein